MKITAAILQGLLLVASSCSQDICRRETQQVHYYVYNANVKVKSYYCLLDTGDNLSCETFNNGKTITNNHQSILKKCRRIYNNLEIRLCEVHAKVNLLENKITLVSNTTCHYNIGYCYDSVYVFWEYEEKCQNLIRMYSDTVDVWTVGQNQMKFIHNDRFNLMLKERTELCGVDVWKTLHDGIIVSTNYINSLRGNLLKLEDVAPKACNITAKNIQEKWYFIYKYPAHVTVFYCLPNYGHSCEKLELDDPEYNWNNKCINQFFKFSPYKNSKVKTCQKTHTIDLQKNTVRGLQSNCTYTSGICQEFKGFWNYTDVCSTIQNVYKGYVGIQTNSNHRTLIYGSHGLDLIREGKLCGETVWYTDQDGFVASEKELQFSNSGNIVFPKDDKSFGISLQTEISVGNIRNSFGKKIPNYKLDNTASPPQNRKSKPVDLYVSQQSDQKQFEDSEKELQHLHSAISLSNKMDEESLHSQNKENSYLQTFHIYIALFIFFCLLVYIFNVVVNFVSLKKLNKARTSKSQTYLMNCVSQSLTTRYLYFSWKEEDNPEEGVAVSADNELYNKPLSDK